MRTLKILALTAVSLTVVVALAVSAGACDKTKTTEATTTSVKTADAKVAGTGCSSATKTTTATTATTASAGCTAAEKAAAGCTSAKGATATVAGVGCSSAKGATATTAGVGCASSAKVAGADCSKSAMEDMRVEAVRLPSGIMAVFYTGSTEATVASLQSKVEAGAAEFGCNLAGSMAKNESCTVEVTKVSNGVMMLVTSEKAEVLDEYEAKYEVAMATHAGEPEGE